MWNKNNLLITVGFEAQLSPWWSPLSIPLSSITTRTVIAMFTKFWTYITALQVIHMFLRFSDRRRVPHFKKRLQRVNGLEKCNSTSKSDFTAELSYKLGTWCSGKCRLPLYVCSVVFSSSVPGKSILPRVRSAKTHFQTDKCNSHYARYL